MKKKILGWIGVSVALISILVILTIILLPGLNGYVAEDKDEINDNIDNSDEIISYDRVYLYLRKWGMPIFDQTKFSYFEYYINRYYAYEGGVPDARIHAEKTAEFFLENYYDSIDLNDSVAVTDALLKCYVSVLDDPYSTYRPPVETEDYNTDMSGTFGGIGVVVEYNSREETIRVTTVYQNSPAEKCGIKVGDYIQGVNGKDISEIGYNNAVNHIRGKIGTTVDITLLRDGELVNVTATRALVEEINASYEIDENGIGYVEIVAFKENTFAQFKKAIDALEEAGVKGIIFDLRNNPGGYVDSVVAVISYLIPDGNPVMSYKYNGYDEVVLLSQDDEGDHVVDLPFVVICNGNTASAGEIFTAAIRDYRDRDMMNATIVGTTTYKKGVMQSSFYYSKDQSSMTFTVAYYKPPYGDNYHGIGVAPDVVVENTEAEDLQLKEAYIQMEKLLSVND